MQENAAARVEESYFEGRQKRLWAAALAVSFVLLCGGVALALCLPPRAHGGYTLNIVFGVCAFLAACVFGVCIATVRMRTSRWVADEKGIAYFALGRKCLFLAWAEVREAGYLQIRSGQNTAYYLYWSKQALSSACRAFLKDGVMEGKRAMLGASNRRGADTVLYAIAPGRGEEPLAQFTEARLGCPLKHREIAARAAEAEPM